MVDFFDEINGLEYLFLLKIGETEVNKLKIVVKEATISSQQEDLVIAEKNLGPMNSVLLDGPGKEYEIYFNTYVSYGVVNESFSCFNEAEERIGRLFCIYSKSLYLDYIRQDTIAEFVMEKKVKHFAINCLNHVINVASFDDPLTTRKSH